MVVTGNIDAAGSVPYFVGQFIGGIMLSVAIIKIVVTAIFMLIVLGTTDENGVPKGFGPIAAGFGLALVPMISIPVSNTSVNPARSLATAVFQGDWALGQVWAFIVFPASTA
jgi:aquaporin Z